MRLEDLMERAAKYDENLARDIKDYVHGRKYGLVYEASKPEFVRMWKKPVERGGDKPYHVVINGQAAGPFDAATLTQMAAAGQLTADSLVWKAGMAQWEKAGAMEDLKDVLATVVPPIPSEE